MVQRCWGRYKGLRKGTVGVETVQVGVEGAGDGSSIMDVRDFQERNTVHVAR